MNKALRTPSAAILLLLHVAILLIVNSVTLFSYFTYETAIMLALDIPLIVLLFAKKTKQCAGYLACFKHLIAAL